MKTWGLFLLVTAVSFSVKAANLSEALDQEAKNLQSQIEEVQRAQASLKLNHAQNMKSLQTEYLQAQKELIQLQAKTQKTSDEFQALKTEFGNLQKVEERVESSWERLYKIWREKESFYLLYDGSQNLKSWLEFKAGKEFISLEQKREVLKGLFDYLNKSQKTEEISVNYLDGNDLVADQVLRVGTLGVQIKKSHLPLAPVSEGVLSKQFEKTQVGSEGIFIFKELRKGAFKAEAGLWERIVFFLPGVFLVLLFLIVFGLFGMFIRE